MRLSEQSPHALPVRPWSSVRPTHESCVCFTWVLRLGYEGMFVIIKNSDAVCTCQIHDRACKLIEPLTPVYTLHGALRYVCSRLYMG